MAQFRSRLRLAWAQLAAKFKRMILKMAFENLKAAVAIADAAADRFIADCSAHQAKIADLESQNASLTEQAKTLEADLEAQAAAIVQPTLDKIVTAAPPAPAPALVDSSGATATDVTPV